MEGLARLWSHKALDFCQGESVHSAGRVGCAHGKIKGGRVALLEAPAAKLRLKRYAAQAESFFFFQTMQFRDRP